MPRRSSKTLESEKPAFEFTPKQMQLVNSTAQKRLAVGGVRSSKTVGALMYMVFGYNMAFEKCDILVLRRTSPELESGVIADFRTFIPPNLYDWNDSKKIATWFNGSRTVFGHCVHNKERDIEKYLGQSYPGILVDECSQFSPDAWELLSIRNTINPGCKPGADGQFPVPCLWGCTNPIGAWWPFYKTIFIDREPFVQPEGARKDADGVWWAPEAGDWRMIYNPVDYDYSHSTVLDNPHMLRRDPGIVQRLNALPKAKRDKMLLGLFDKVAGQYFDCFDPSYHVINRREDPDAIVWQNWQPVWMGQDWGRNHGNSVFFFTKAMVRKSVGAEYTPKTVCFGEILETDKSNVEMADIMALKAKHLCDVQGGSPESKNSMKVSAIYFSHEKFSRQMEANSPADDFSNLLRERGLCAVTPASRDRVASASFMYNMLKDGKLVILDSCPRIIRAIPTLQRHPEHLDDVLKTDSEADDLYDGFRYGLFGQLGPRQKPQWVKDREQINAIHDPFQKALAVFKHQMTESKVLESFHQRPVEPWRARFERSRIAN